MGQGSRRARRSVWPQGNESLCGRGLEGLQLICRSLGAWTNTPSTDEPTFMAIRDWSKRRLARLWLAGLVFELALVFVPVILRPPDVLRRHGVTMRDSLSVIRGRAIDLDTLSPSVRDSIITVAREGAGKAVVQMGMAVGLMGLLVVGLYAAVPVILIVVAVIWLRQHQKTRGDPPRRPGA